MSETKEFALYHGARAWSGLPEIRPHAQGRAEHGPGLYMTNDAEFARTFGYLIRMRIRTGIRWSTDARVSGAACQKWLEEQAHGRDGFPSAKKHAETTLTILRGTRSRRPDDQILASSFIAISSPFHTKYRGVQLARFLAENGVHGAYESRGRIVVIFDPTVILAAEHVTPKEIGSDGFQWVLPAIQTENENTKERS